MLSRKKIIRICLIALMLIVCLLAWRIFGSNTSFEEDKKILYIKTGSSYSRVENLLQLGGFVKNNRSFNRVARFHNYHKNVKPGRYVIEKGASIYSIIKLLQSGNQTPVSLVITKLRTRDDLIKKIASNFECESKIIKGFLNNNDSLSAYHLDTNTVMTAITPNSYSILWNASFHDIFQELYKEKEKFWTSERKKKAAALGLTPEQVYTIASIVEEETAKEGDMGKIASVYLNRLAIGMKLGADPTIKFALKDFDLRRIYQKHLTVQSPYNTYINKGLPPGPICTATERTIDAVLNAPATNYLYFVAKPELDGYSNFASNYEEHLRYAKAYQDALDTIMRRRAEGREQ
ncbi:MAG: endolytic transglycosylase MltG [Chitinophagaceae bacterium]|nr:endolytic transglycosylase MltG [Chitinophagaceae bacterium]